MLGFVAVIGTAIAMMPVLVETGPLSAHASPPPVAERVLPDTRTPTHAGTAALRARPEPVL
jgi:hypothetical protein